MPAIDLASIAEEHARLMHEVVAFDHAPADLRDTTELLESLETAIAAKESLMEQLVAKRKAEHRDFDKLTRSTTKRFLVRVKHGGKEGLERRLEKEEKEYIEAAQKEHNESLVIADLKAAAENARIEKAQLEAHVAARKDMLKRMSSLYESAFEGPSPDFPEEDAVEDEVREAEVHFEHTQLQLTHEKSVFALLDRAARCANDALAALQSADRSATYDTFGVGGLWVEMAERDDLLRAQSLAAQAQHQIERAQAREPRVQQISCGRIVSPDWLNVVFDNLYTDYVFQQKIKQSLGTVRAFQQAVFGECAASEARTEALKGELDDAKEHLRTRRIALAAVRREILRRLHEAGGVFAGAPASGNAPPTYMASPEAGTRTLQPGPGRAEGVEPPRYDSEGGPSASASTTTPYAPPPGPPPNRSRPSSAGGSADFARSRSPSPATAVSSTLSVPMPLSMPPSPRSRSHSHSPLLSPDRVPSPQVSSPMHQEALLPPDRVPSSHSRSRSASPRPSMQQETSTHPRNPFLSEGSETAHEGAPRLAAHNPFRAPQDPGPRPDSSVS